MRPQNSIWKIIAKHTLTIFNLVNLILAVMIILVGSYKNLLFILIAIANTMISIINELRARRIVNKMHLLSEQKPTILKHGQPRQVRPETLQIGDILLLGLGDQIPTDATVKQGNIEVNEALLTGEQDNIAKHPGDSLISGSFIVSGSCEATVTATLKDSFISKVETSALTIKTADSQLFTILNNIVKYISFALIPIGILLLLARFRVPGTTTEVAVTSTVAALINMIPEGLVLLTSSVLALATIRLSKKQVLVQDLYSIETLARVDCICLDKTGTLTTGKMKLKQLVPADGQSKQALTDALKLILAHSDADTSTSRALKKQLFKPHQSAPDTPILETISFSSDRKYSGVRTKSATFLMGALEFMTKNSTFLAAERPFTEHYRVISVLKTTGKRETLLGFALLEDELRRDAHDIIDFFAANDIAVKIISGDNLNTVTSVAAAAGVPTARAIDLSAATSPLNYHQLAQNYDIFARVTPHQKKSLVLALKKQGQTVAMTGDGVNDILAMKEADCSLAIGEGADAARRSAKLVLLGNDFGAVPAIIAEGRQTINNLERSASLFLTKTVYAAILAIIFVFAPLEYPFSPIAMSLLNFLCIGLPGLVLTLEPNTARVKNQFVANIKRFSLPTGIAISVAVLIIAILARLLALPHDLTVTIAVITVFALDFILLCRVSRPLSKLRATLLFVILALFLLALFTPLPRDFLDFYSFF